MAKRKSLYPLSDDELGLAIDRAYDVICKTVPDDWPRQDIVSVCYILAAGLIELHQRMDRLFR